MEQLKEQVAKRIQRGERAEQSLGNVDASSGQFRAFNSNNDSLPTFEIQDCVSLYQL